VFAAAGSVPIRGSAPVNELAEIQIAKLRAARRSSEHGESGISTTSSHGGFKTAASKIGHQNRCACRLH